MLELNQNYAILKHSYTKTPSWKKYGDKGRAVLELHYHYESGCLSICAKEIPENYRGTKEVFLELPPEQVAELAKMLTNRKRP